MYNKDAPVSQSTIKWRKTMVAKYGSLEAFKEHQRQNGRSGGSKSAVKGFALMTPERRKEISKMGGTISKRK